MTTTTDNPAVAEYARAAIFRRILVGIDESPESLEAARQAATLATGSLTLLAAYDLTQTIVGGGMAPAPVAPLDEGPARESAEHALGRARQEIGSDEPAGKIARGRSWEVLLDEIALEHVTLVAVGSHGAGRARGIVIGSTATELVHKAPCSVLVARKPLKDFPGPIAVGVDGSKEAAAADAVAGALAKRFGARLERLENLPDPVSGLVHAGGGAEHV